MKLFNLYAITKYMPRIEVQGKGSEPTLHRFIYLFVLQVKAILRSFKVATVALSTDKYPTASADDDTAAVKEMKAKITADLNKYPEDGDVFMFLNTASYLDPHFQCRTSPVVEGSVGLSDVL